MSYTKKKILFHLTNPPIPADSGAKTRDLGSLKYFSHRKEFFTVHAFSANSFNNVIWNLEHSQEVLKVVDNFFLYSGEDNLLDFLYSRTQSFYHQKLLRQQLPVDSDYYTPPGYVKFVQRLISQEEYDYIWINHLENAHLVVNSKSLQAHTIIDMHDFLCDLRLARKNIFPLEGLKFDYEANFVKEVKLLKKFNTIVACSQEEQEKIYPFITEPKIHLIPHLSTGLNSTSNTTPYSMREFKYDLFFVGTNYQLNADGINFFIEQIIQKILEQKPDLRLLIAGKVAELIQVDKALEQNVICMGYVPDLAELYLQSRVVICPLLRGSGTKVKLLEAIAYAMPIVTTTTGASGLSLKDGINAFITDDPELYAQRVLNLLKEPKLAQKVSEEVAITFENEYSISSIYSKLDAMLGI